MDQNSIFEIVEALALGSKIISMVPTKNKKKIFIKKYKELFSTCSCIIFIKDEMRHIFI